jgi:sporadic carbohydrate cluster protein (TIGR04323 family)
MIKKQGYRGYCTHSSFGGYKIPVPAQNILFRDYSKKNNIHQKLSINELNFKKCYVQLDYLLEQLHDLEGILMCSIFMLPDDCDCRMKIYEKLINSNSKLLFVLENLQLYKLEDVNYIENILKINNLNINTINRADTGLLLNKECID